MIIRNGNGIIVTQNGYGTLVTIGVSGPWNQVCTQNAYWYVLSMHGVCVCMAMCAPLCACVRLCVWLCVCCVWGYVCVWLVAHFGHAHTWSLTVKQLLQPRPQEGVARARGHSQDGGRLQRGLHHVWGKLQNNRPCWLLWSVQTLCDRVEGVAYVVPQCTSASTPFHYTYHPITHAPSHIPPALQDYITAQLATCRHKSHPPSQRHIHHHKVTSIITKSHPPSQSHIHAMTMSHPFTCAITRLHINKFAH